MLKNWRVLRVLAMTLGGVLALPAAVLAERATVVLKDGRTLEGELAEYYPSDHVTLVLANAQRHEIAAADVASVQVHATREQAAANVVPDHQVLPRPLAPPAAAAEQPVDNSQNSGARAGSVPSARSRLQLGLSAPFVRYSSVTRTADNGQKQETSNTQWGLLRAAALELGYGVSDLLVIGAVVQLNGDTNSSELFDASAFGLFIGPKLDLQLDSSTRFKPFFGAVLGLSYASNESTSMNASALSTSTNQTTLFRMQARVGVRWFVTDDASVDLALTGGFETGNSTSEVSNASTGPLSFATSGTFIGLNLGMSVWPDLS